MQAHHKKKTQPTTQTHRRSAKHDIRIYNLASSQLNQCMRGAVTRCPFYITSRNLPLIVGGTLAAFPFAPSIPLRKSGRVIAFSLCVRPTHHRRKRRRRRAPPSSSRDNWRARVYFRGEHLRVPTTFPKQGPLFTVYLSSQHELRALRRPSSDITFARPSAL